jgi:hypothetical protein
MDDTAEVVRLFSDALGVGILAVILLTCLVTTVVALRSINRTLVAAGRSELVLVAATLLVGFVIFIGGWLVLDAFWLCTKAPVWAARRLRLASRT